MDARQRIERALTTAIERVERPGAPPRLAGAMRHAIFPGGARIRPRLTLAVAMACGEDAPDVTEAAAAAIELLHCASLVHDDLPCFDDAATRRGRPSVHRAYGEPLAVLAGDALIVLAFQTLAHGAALAPHRLAALLINVGAAVGAPNGIVAGQAWESEPKVELSVYHRAKTGVLFGAATTAGAMAVGAEPNAWRLLGERLGEAFQVADDLKDAVGDAEDIGKPVGRDAALARASAVADLGIAGAVALLERLVDEAVDSIPACAGASELRTLMRREAMQFLPKRLARHAA
ncbi:MAG TPA: polyprenyl synthetase family protein [Beijerinckiaceae bacterium]